MAKVLEKDWHDVSLHDVKQYFETLSLQIRSIPSGFAWNADEPMVGCSKKTFPLEIIVVTNPKLGSVTIRKARDDAPRTLLTVISAFAVFARGLSFSKPKMLEKMLCTAQKPYAGHDHAIRSASNTFLTELLLIDSLEDVFLSRISELRTKFAYDGRSFLVLDGHLTHVTARVI
jgi:hypothetical protein